MDSLSQAALGGAVAVIVTGGKSPKRAIIYGVTLGTLPDLDVLLPFRDDVQAMIQHRTWTHSWLVHLLLGPLLGCLLAWRDKTWPVTRWIALVLLVLVTHSALDAFTIYGTWVLWPMMDQPWMGGSIFIIDPLYTLPLVIGLVIVWRTGKSARAVRVATFGILVSSGYLGWGLAAKAHIEALAQQSLTASGLEWNQITATPTPFNSVLWRIIAMDDAVYHEGYYGFLDNDKEIAFHSYPLRPELADRIDPTTGFADLIQFNHGYFKLAEQDGMIVVSDLRMGVEPFFFFRFAMTDPDPAARIPRGLPEAVDVQRMFGWLGRRLVGNKLAPLATTAVDAGGQAE